jgi:quercetin dioxygenase-like cupin family protein
MKLYRMSDMVKGWFVGDFEPTALPSNQFEVGLKHYKQGDSEQRHVHKVATEITVVVNGEVRMNGETFRTGDIIVLEPGEPADFAAVTDASTVVVKTPSAPRDKYFV